MNGVAAQQDVTRILEVDQAHLAAGGVASNIKEDDAAVAEHVVIAIQQTHRVLPFKDYSRTGRNRNLSVGRKIMTVVLDTDHDVHYRPVDERRWICRSHTTRIAEVEGAGTPQERVRPPDAGYGFLWRLNSYWRFQEREDGVYVECRAVSLTRDVPFGLGWVIEPIIQKLPKESLINTLEATRRALPAAAK